MVLAAIKLIKLRWGEGVAWREIRLFWSEGEIKGNWLLEAQKNFKDSRKWEAHAKKEKEEIGYPY